MLGDHLSEEYLSEESVIKNSTELNNQRVTEFIYTERKSATKFRTKAVQSTKEKLIGIIYHSHTYGPTS
jgi:hypothetical protein